MRQVETPIIHPDRRRGRILNLETARDMKDVGETIVQTRVDNADHSDGFLYGEIADNL